MTALKPLETHLLRGVAARRYPLNKKCAHPECQEDAVDPHHCFPRSLTGNDSWFVIFGDSVHDLHSETSEEKGGGFRAAIPHVTGLCRAHHDNVELHQAWIKLEEGEWRWYDRFHKEVIDNALTITLGKGEQGCPPERECNLWGYVGPLNPQPGSVEGKPKKKRHKGEARRRRITISIKVPKDEQEDGAGLLDEAIEILEAKISGDNARPVYYTIMDALSFTNLNAGPDDFKEDE